jgi:hypothetical protein
LPTQMTRRHCPVSEMHSTKKARKEHECSKCHQPITVGTVYDTVSLPPWMDFEGDVNEDGRPIAVLRAPEERRWTVEKFHPRCYEAVMTGYDW